MNHIPRVAEIESRIAEISTRVNGGQNTTPNSGAQFQSILNDTVNGGILGERPSSAPTLTAGFQPGLNGLSTLTSAAQTRGVTGASAVTAGRKYLGVPYVWGGNDPSVGLDCSSLVQRAYADIGIKLPRVAADQARQGTAVSSLAQAKPGDLVAFGSPVDHIGIYVGDNKMLVAPRKGDVVKIQEVYKTPTAIRRIIPDAPASAFSLAASLPASATTSNVGAGITKASLQSRYNNLFIEAGNKYDIDPQLLAAVAKQESGFNPAAKSSAGALGLMQFMPATARSMGVDPLIPEQAVDGAARMLRDLKVKFGSIPLALAAYNAGPGNVQKYGGIPPFRETQNYVKNILSMVGTTA